MPAWLSLLARRMSAKAQKLSESSSRSLSFIQPSAETIKYSIRPFGVFGRRRIALNE